MLNILLLLSWWVDKWAFWLVLWFYFYCCYLFGSGSEEAIDWCWIWLAKWEWRVGIKAWRTIFFHKEHVLFGCFWYWWEVSRKRLHCILIILAMSLKLEFELFCLLELVISVDILWKGMWLICVIVHVGWIACGFLASGWLKGFVNFAGIVLEMGFM